MNDAFDHSYGRAKFRIMGQSSNHTNVRTIELKKVMDNIESSKNINAGPQKY